MGQSKPVSGSSVTPLKQMVVSNHYPIAPKSFKFFEFHVRFIHQKDLPTLLAMKDFFDNDAVNTDSRETIFQIYRKNKDQIEKAIGEHSLTGVTMFSFRKPKEDQIHFEEHPEFVMILALKNKYTSEELVANEKVRIPALRCLNVFVKNIMRKLKMVEFGKLKKYYNTEEEMQLTLDGGLEISLFKGFKTAFEVYESGPRLLVNFVCRIVRKKSVWEEFLDAQKQGFKDDEICEKLIIGKSVITIYGNHKPYRIDKIDLKKKITDPFPHKDYKSFKDYYERKYKQKIFHNNQFLVVSVSKRKMPDGSVKEEDIYLVPELLRPTGLTDEIRKNFKIMRELSQHTIKRPAERFKMTDEMVNTFIKSSKNSALSLELQKESTVNALQFPTPKIYGAKNSIITTNGDRINLNGIAESCEIKNWIMIYEPFTEENSHIAIENFHKACKKFNIKFNEASEYLKSPKNSNAAVIWDLICKSKCKSPNLIMFFVSKKTASARFYQDCKRFFDIKGIVTQFFVSFNPHKDTMGLAKYSNILLQMANKLKSNLWYIDTQVNDLLVLGADVGHGAKNRSVASVVGMWGEFLKYSYSETNIQKKGQEVMHNVAAMVLKIVAKYMEMCKNPPKHIVFYRDGVGEGQHGEIANVEVKSIQDQLAAVYPKNTPKLMFVIVTKRIDDRFASNFGSLENPNTGLIVHKDVVKKDLYQFFMVSQNVTQGTATPTSYEVMLDEINWDRNFFYQFTYNQTFNYYNWMGAVKVPAAVQYAHKLCDEKTNTMDINVADQLKFQKYYM